MFHRILVAALALISLSGCSSGPLKKDSSASFALNVVKAAGMDYRLKDKELPKNTVARITDSAGFGLAYAASGFTTSVPGLSPSDVAGLNFVAWLLGPKPPAARNSLIAWMPEEAAGANAENSLADLLLEGASKGVEELGFKAKTSIAAGGTDKSGVAVYLIGDDGSPCEETEHGYSKCWMNFGIRNAEKRNIVPEVVGQSGAAWFFNPGVKRYSRFGFPKENPGQNELEILVAISKYVPEWVYFYVAPGKISVAPDQPIKLPMVIHQGGIHYFIKPVANQG
ncbi:MAG: hypothetical protein OIF51_17350 [Cellvibrionaceae bacterium]|nr:hypothetical protein [Cellvibrionaceae bacterium]